MSSDFRHRTNDNGNFDSICLRCFRTVASDNDEGSLRKKELQHRCEVEDLATLRAEIRLTREGSIEEAYPVNKMVDPS